MFAIRIQGRNKNDRQTKKNVSFVNTQIDQIRVTGRTIRLFVR